MSKFASDYCFESETSAPTEMISRARRQDCIPTPCSVTHSNTDLNTGFSSYQLPKIKVALTMFLYLWFVFEKHPLQTFSLAQEFLENM